MYTLNFTIPTNKRDLADAVAYGFNADGCLEEQFGRDIKLTFYFSDRANADAAVTSLSDILSVDNPTIEFIDDNQDWNAKWRESMDPAEIADGVWVSPTWLEPPADRRKIWIKIEPKMAFGTGHHETTRLAAKELIARKNQIAGKRLLDIGTGSGVLCFVADYVEAETIVGVEIDSVCLENLAENLRDNPPRENSRVNFVIGTLDSISIYDGKGDNGGDPCDKKFDAVIMNMLSTESEPLLPQIKKIIKKDALLIWSGILTDEREDVIAAAERYGFKLIGDRVENEWWCGTFVNYTPRICGLLPFALALAAALAGCAGVTVMDAAVVHEAQPTIYGNPLATTIAPVKSDGRNEGAIYIMEDRFDDQADPAFATAENAFETAPVKTQATPTLPETETLTQRKAQQDVPPQQPPPTQEKTAQQLPAAAGYVWYGDGSATGFNIETAAELAEFTSIVNGTTGGTPAQSDFSGKIVNLIKPINLNNAPWTPIGGADNPFRGQFNGGWHLISGLNVNNGALDFQGLFGYVGVGGSVNNVGVSGSVSGGNFVGGVVGSNDGTMLNCGFAGSVSGSGGSVGGIAGKNGGAISVCYNVGKVSGVTGGIGGLVGENIGIVSNCYNTGNVSGAQNEHGNYTGGIAGKNAGALLACYNIGGVSGSGGRYGRGGVGGIVGISGDSDANVQHSVSLGLNASLTGRSGSVGRVVGAFTGGKIINNKARSDMRIGVKGAENMPTASTGAYHINGASVPLGTPLSEVFGDWDVTIWDIPFGAALSAKGGLPTLRDAP